MAEIFVEQRGQQYVGLHGLDRALIESVLISRLIFASSSPTLDPCSKDHKAGEIS